MDNVILTTERTEMKFPVGLISADDIVRTINDKATLKFMSAFPATYTHENALEFMEFLESTRNLKTCLELGIFDKESGQFIGMCELDLILRSAHTCELGYWLNKDFVGKGYMYECVSALIKYAKDELGIHTLSAFVIAENTRSISLLERLGFQKVNFIPGSVKNKGHRADEFIYELHL